MQAAKFVKSYVKAWNRNDPERVAGHLAANGIYHDVPANVRRTHDELIVTLNDFFLDFPHHYEIIGDIVSNQNTIAYQYRVCPVKGPGRKRLASYCGAEFITLDGDAAVTIKDYYDFPIAAQKGKYAKSGLQRSQMQELKTRLEHIMVTEQAYLRPNLTLPLLAETVGCSVNHLSQVINAGFNMSFFDYLNNHRIEHARSLLTGVNGSGGAVLNIAFSVGFNSNSAFYAAFKKHVGMTPAQYRKASAGTVAG
jgi:AraC-like DNA-binding protein